MPDCESETSTNSGMFSWPKPAASRITWKWIVKVLLAVCLLCLLAILMMRVSRPGTLAAAPGAGGPSSDTDLDLVTGESMLSKVHDEVHRQYEAKANDALVDVYLGDRESKQAEKLEAFYQAQRNRKLLRTTTAEQPGLFELPGLFEQPVPFEAKDYPMVDEMEDPADGDTTWAPTSLHQPSPKAVTAPRPKYTTYLHPPGPKAVTAPRPTYRAFAKQYRKGLKGAGIKRASKADGYVPDDVLKQLRFPCKGMKDANWLGSCPKTCDLNPGPIPSIVHFILLNNVSGLPFWLAVRSAIVHASPDAIHVYSAVKKEAFTGNCWLLRALSLQGVKFHYLPLSRFPQGIRGWPIRFIAHYSDWLRLAVLWAYGGIYMDTDSIMAKSIEPLMMNHAVLARQATQRPGNGMIIAQRHSCFICHYAQQACASFDSQWATHSSLALKNILGDRFPPKVRSPLIKNVVVLNYTKGFFPFAWTNSTLAALFTDYTSDASRARLDVYAVHLYNFVSKSYQKVLYDYRWITRRDTFLSKVVNDVLPPGFNRESMDQRKCLKLRYS